MEAYTNFSPFTGGKQSQMQFGGGIRTPAGFFKPSAIPIAAAGFAPSGSLYNMQPRVANPAGKTTFSQAVRSRVPNGWATNPFNGRTALLTGNGFSGGQV